MVKFLKKILARLFAVMHECLVRHCFPIVKYQTFLVHQEARKAHQNNCCLHASDQSAWLQGHQRRGNIFGFLNILMFIFLICWKASCMYIVVREQFGTLVFLGMNSQSTQRAIWKKKCHLPGAEAYNLINFSKSVDAAFKATSTYKAKLLFFYANDKHFVRTARGARTATERSPSG